MFTALDLVAMLRQEASLQSTLAWGDDSPKANAHRTIGLMLDSLADRIEFEVRQRQQAEARAREAARIIDQEPIP
jgi:hypothetical protein